ncbi:MAG: hypothetical protein OER92_07305 [Alphaproteobacteria bacterium]|nr:hypothetical protein [Alphaproteobacteria bacterium]
MPAEEASSIRHIHGSCHCGNIRFVFRRPETGDGIAVRACGCTFCLKHRGVWTSHPQGRVELAYDDSERVQRYRFGTATADFYICRECGVAPIVTSDIDGSSYAVVNVNCFDDVDRAELVETATDFDGEATDDRLARRQRNWSPLVMTA